MLQIAVEQAVRLKEAKKASEVVAVSIGPKQCTETLRTALAMGCDRGIHVLLNDQRTDTLEPYAVAQIFQELVAKEQSDLILLGKQAIDSDCGQTGPMLAGLLDAPQATFAASLEVMDDGSITVERETDAGTETLSLKSKPAVVTCDLRLNEPRYATLPNIMKAKKKPIETIEGTTLAPPQQTILEIMEPAPRKEGIKVADVDELIDKLRNEAKVIP